MLEDQMTRAVAERSPILKKGGWGPGDDERRSTESGAGKVLC